MAEASRTAEARTAEAVSLRAALAEAQGQLASVRQELLAAQQAAQLGQQAAQEAERVAGEAQQAASQAAAAERARVEAQLRAEGQAKARAEQETRGLRAAAERRDLRPELDRRDLRTTAQRRAVFEALLAARPGAVANALAALDAEAMRDELERLVQVCDAPGCQPASPDTPIMRVTSVACEVCGGSDIQRVFVAFAAACEAAGHRRVTFVGGSPAYREKLSKLQRQHAPSLTIAVLQAERAGEGKRAQKTRGLVVIWGATEVDHTMTWHYQDAGDEVIRLNHRGIVGMLQAVEAELARRAQATGRRER